MSCHKDHEDIKHVKNLKVCDKIFTDMSVKILISRT